jgi:nucleoid DNA-binding protein
MLELYLSKVSESSESELAGKTYARVDYKETLTVQDMAQHMAEHNTAFSEGTITGILIDFVKCIREQVLMGNTVKINNLAIFKATVEGNALDVLYDPATDKTVTASMGTLKPGDKTGPAVKVIKLLAQSTGELTRDELKKDVKFAWTDKTKAEIAAAKAAATGSSESNSGNGGSQSGNGGSQSGNGGNSQATSFALTITKSGSGTSTVKNDSEETINSGDTLASGANVYISVTPAEGQIPTATLNGTNVSLTENDGEYIGTFQMPAQASSLVINSGSDSEEGDQN